MGNNFPARCGYLTDVWCKKASCIDRMPFLFIRVDYSVIDFIFDLAMKASITAII